MSDSFEHYRLLEDADGAPMELGRGAMGVTYKALDTNLHCEVALKVIATELLDSPTAAERFLREARAAAQLRHRNVATVFHLGKRGESFFYAMEFIAGETVDAVVRRDGPIPVATALEIAQQVACALIAAETQNLVHRDIKPSNLMLIRESDGEILVKVIDFGLVKSAVLQSSNGSLTAGGFVGTPYFASPEQLDQQTEDIRSDLYSLGVTLWYMLTGKPTFIGSVASVIAQHLERSPSFEALAILPAPVIALLRRMLKKSPAERIQTPSELRAELKKCQQGLSATTTELLGAQENFETMVLSGPPSRSSRVQAGMMLNDRYRLLQDLHTLQPGRTFHAEDLRTRTRVLVRILHLEPGGLEQLKAEMARLESAGQPGFMLVLAVEWTRQFAFMVLEWLEGFPLLEPLRARREFTLRETLLLLQQIAPAVDEARALGLKLEMKPRDIMVHFPDGHTEMDGPVMLRCPLDEWPVFVVKLNPLGRVADFEKTDTWHGQQTMLPSAPTAEFDEVMQLGLLAYELLGGKMGRFSPLANVSEAGNAVLRRCLAPEQGFATARDFYRALSATVQADVLPAWTAEKVATASVPARPVASNAGMSVTEVVPPPAKPQRLVLALAVAGVAVLAAGAGLFFDSLLHPPIAPKTAVTPTPAPPSTLVLPPLVTGQPWKNSLEMPFVPLGDVSIAVAPTRVRDFKAFVDATGYDAVGGMSSVISRDGFKQTTMSWADPGFAQTPEHPVVGVCWEDANQFCAWLTKRERAAGALKSYQSYRLPTDREWSEAVGLSYEPDATPEERSGKVKGYPWGENFPPPTDAANYAGTESRTGAPETWQIVPDFHDAFARTAPVTAFRPNARGLASLGGNVWEWCADRFNGTTPWRTLRGGSWATARPMEMLSSARRGYDPTFRTDEVGFRCVIAADGVTP